jgi:hypothetical protein
MHIKTTMTVDRLPELEAALDALTKNKVMVGIPDVNAGRTKGPASNAVIGYVQEHGSPAQHIPPRPFLEPGVRAAKDDLVVRLKQAADYALQGNKRATIRALHATGIIAQNAVRKKITDGPFIPLAPSTLAARAARGVTRTKPLIDTGQLRAAITYVLRGKWF